MKNKTAATLRPQISRRLQQAILDSGMTYRQIALEVGTPTDVIASYMKRVPRMPLVETLAVLCPVLGVSADWVVLGEKSTHRTVRAKDQPERGALKYGA